MKIAFFCSTPYQIILAIALKKTLSPMTSADIYILNHFSGAEILQSRLHKLNVFKNVTLIDSISFMKEINYKGNVIERSFKKTLLYLNNEYYVGKYGNLADKEYDSIYFTYPSIIIQLITIVLKKKNKKLSINLFEDGLGAYTSSLSSKTTRKKIFNKILGIDEIIDKYDNLYLLNKKLIPNSVDLNINIKEITPLNHEASEILNKLFDFHEKAIIEDKFIFFEQEMDGLVKGIDNRMKEIYLQIENDQMILKKHPRSNFNELTNIKIYQNKHLPWEIIALNSDVENKVLISYYSTALISNKTILDKEPIIIFLYNLEELKDYFWLDKEMIFVIENLKKVYNDSSKIFIPRNLRELKNILSYYK